jgi:FixJ family two-component response regulator
VPDKQPLIAIVDDDESVLEATKSLLRSLGFAAEAFSSGKEFLASPPLRHTACLVADVNMPGMSGLNLHRHLAASGQHVPTILITAYPDDRVRARALGVGVLCYLAKLFGEGDLLSCIRSGLAHRS